MAGLVFSSQNPPQNAKKTQGISCPESLFGPLYVADLVRFSRGEYNACASPREKQSNSAAKNVPLRRAAKAALLSALPAAGLLFRKRTGLIQGSSQMVVVGLLPPIQKATF